MAANRLKTLLTLAVCSASLLALPALAEDKKEPAKVEKTAQQTKMGDCNAEAKEKALKGDERKKFMSSCLSNKPVDGKTAQQEKMKTCNAEAKDKALKGDERKKFMSSCLSNK
jgi:hypothetical protein